MTKLILIILLLANSAYSKPNFEEEQALLLAKLSTTKEQVEAESLAWEENFYQSLAEDADPNIRLLAYSKSLLNYQASVAENRLQDMALDINSMLDSAVLSQKSLATIKEICNTKKMQSFCALDAIAAKEDEMMPNNAYIYLSRLNRAVNDGNQTEVEQIIKNMAQSKYIDIFMYADENFRPKLEAYVKDHPFPKNKLKLEKLMLSSFSHTNPQELDEEGDNMQEVMVFIMVVGAKLSQPIPAYRNVIEECKNNTKIEISCLKMAEIFINHSKTLISTMIGHAIKVEILKQKQDEKKYAQAQLQRKQFKNYYECLANSMNYGANYFTKRGVEFSKTADAIERKSGEIAFFKSLAKMNYDYYSALGDENIKNPENCEN